MFWCFASSFACLVMDLVFAGVFGEFAGLGSFGWFGACMMFVAGI